MKRMPVIINGPDLPDIINLKNQKITSILLKTLFANTSKSEAKYLTKDKISIPKNTLYNNDTILTTIGRYVFNILLNEVGLLQHIGYQNETFNKSAINNLNSKVSNLLLNNKIEIQIVHNYINLLQWFFSVSSFLIPTLSLDFVSVLPSVRKRKEELAKKYKEALENGDIVASSEIEKELINIAKNELKDDASMELYTSGSRGSFENNYKNVAIMRGAIPNVAIPGQFEISLDNLSDGTSKEEYGKFANLTVNGSYARSIQTQIGGYETKKYNAAFQTLVMDEPGSNCNTKRTIKVLLTDSNKKDYLLSYIVVNNKLVLLDDSNINSYIGKTVNMRSPIYCTSEKICNICMGEVYYRMDKITNVGLLLNKISATIMNSSMKQFHDASIK